MAAVAEGLVLGGFAAAEVDFSGFGCVVFDRSEVTAFVGAVAKGLVGAFAAGAPEIGFPFFDFDAIWCVACPNWFAHGFLG